MPRLGKLLVGLIALLLPVSALATCTTGVSGNCEVGAGKTYATIGACLSAATAGQTCLVFVGTYTENPSIPAGTVGNYITVEANGTDIVFIVGAITMNSHTKLIGNCAAIGTQATAGNFGNCGFSEKPTSPAGSSCITISNNATDIFIIGNSFQGCSDGGSVHENSGSTATSVYIGSNTFAYSCSTPASPNVCTLMDINGNNQMLEFNDISHVSDGPYLNGKWIVLRHNAMHDILTTDCGTNSQNCHIDFMQADTSAGPSGGPIQFVLLENNTVNNMQTNGGSVGGAGVHSIGLFQDNACGTNCGNGIVRFHLVSHVDQGGLFNDSGNWGFLKLYNNSFIDVSRKNVANGAVFNTSTAGLNCSEINSLYYFTINLPTGGSQYNPYACQGTSCNTYTFGNSIAQCTGTGGCSGLASHVYGSGSWTNDTGNTIADPLFVNYAGNNFNLQASSPALATGTNLTTVAAGDSGSGTSLVLNDVSFFQDGWGFPAGAGPNQMTPDCISITTVGNHVCIIAINYSTNTVTMASSFNRASGDKVWLYSDSTGTVRLTGSAPNRGALGTGGTLAPPTNLNATPFVKPGL